jgi:membrane associated rhomboid family serine protease
MMWSGKRELLVEELANRRKDALKEYQAEVEEEYQAETGKKKLTMEQRDEIRKEVRRLDRELKRDVADMMPPQQAQFGWWQLLTSSLLHEGILHLAGNMLFLLVFGLRVNELLGNAKMAVVYPLLAVCSAAAHHLSSANMPLAPYLGASGAIMGLAGMYFIFFPAQKVVMAFWIRLWPLPYVWWHKIFRMRGFWMLVFWIALNDLLPMWLKSEDQVAHWAHLGGFISGMVLALAMLIARLASARGTDLITLIFGKAAWGIVGRPA